MASKTVVYADRVVGLSVHNGLVRIDLGVVTGADKGKEGKTALKGETTHQLVIPLEGFVAATTMQGKLVKELAARQKKRRDDKAIVAPATEVQP